MTEETVANTLRTRLEAQFALPAVQTQLTPPPRSSKLTVAGYASMGDYTEIDNRYLSDSEKFDKMLLSKHGDKKMITDNGIALMIANTLLINKKRQKQEQIQKMMIAAGLTDTDMEKYIKETLASSDCVFYLDMPWMMEVFILSKSIYDVMSENRGHHKKHKKERKNTYVRQEGTCVERCKNLVSYCEEQKLFGGEKECEKIYETFFLFFAERITEHYITGVTHLSLPKKVKDMDEHTSKLVVEGALHAILDGDTLYNTIIGKLVWGVLSNLLNSVDNYSPSRKAEQLVCSTGGRANGNQSDELIYNSSFSPGTGITPSFLARISGCPVEQTFSIGNDLVEQFVKEGCTKTEARDYAIITETLWMEKRLRMGINPDDTKKTRMEKEQDWEDTALKNMLGTEQNLNGKKLTEEKEELEKKNQALEKKIEILESRVQKLQKENQRICHENESLHTQKDPEPHNKEETSFSEQTQSGASLESREENQDKCSFPFRTGKKILVYGEGHRNFLQQLKTFLPDLQIQTDANQLDVTPIRNADFVFIQWNHIGHTEYWKICNVCKKYHVPYMHLESGGARKCAEFIENVIKEKLELGETTTHVVGKDVKEEV